MSRDKCKACIPDTLSGCMACEYNFDGTCNLDKMSYQQALKYKDNWIELKKQILLLQRNYLKGAMMSLEESVQGNRTCEIILRAMNDIENASNSVVDGKCKYHMKSRAYRACTLCDSKNICKYVDDGKTAAEKLDEWQHARKA